MFLGSAARNRASDVSMPSGRLGSKEVPDTHLIYWSRRVKKTTGRPLS